MPKSVFGKSLGSGVAWIRRRRVRPFIGYNSRKRRRLIHGTQFSKAIPEPFRTSSKCPYSSCFVLVLVLVTVIVIVLVIDDVVRLRTHSPETCIKEGLFSRCS